MTESPERSDALHLEATGEGPPTVLLLHSLALDSTIWSDIVPLISGFCRVLRCDLPGHGWSREVPVSSVEAMADAIADALRARGEGPIVVWGMSLGGNVAQSLTARHPELVAALGLADTTAWYGEDASVKWAERAEVARSRGMAALSDFQLARWFSRDFLDQNPGVAQRLLDVFAANDVDAYVRTCHAMGVQDLRQATSTITVPTMVLVGELDPATPLPHAEDLHARISGSSLEVVPGASHLSPLERPELFAARVKELCDRASVPS
jgi:3-oxoadipate enol-lactonase